MKICKIIFILGALFALGSCTDDLEYINYADINPSNFPKSETDVDLLVNECYRIFRTSSSGNIHSTGSIRGLMFIDGTTGILSRPTGNQLKAAIHDYNPTDVAFTRYYDEFYNHISLITMTIDMIEQMDVSNTKKEQAIAEIRFLRGYLAYVLFDLFGPIVIAPLEILKSPLKEEPLARLGYDEMVAFIEQDLEYAWENLPHPSETEYGKVSSGLAKMILIRLDLHEKRWEKVIQHANDIIALNYYALENDYLKMWRVDGAIDSKEVIWAIPCDYQGRNFNEWHYAALPNSFAKLVGMEKTIPFGTSGSQGSTWWFYDSFDKEDVRKTNLITEFVGRDGNIYNRENPDPTQRLLYGPLPMKFDLDADRPSGSSSVDVVLYRYADVLLSKAEALANLKGAPDQESVDLVNIIRRRAGIKEIQLSGYQSLVAFNDMILMERGHEFWCENGQYRADLIRHDKYVSRCIELTGSTYTGKHRELFPFSLARIAEGKGKFLQNPGYN